MKIAVLGLGVGYALSCALAEAGHDVIGIDTNPEVVRNPRRDKSVERLLETGERKIAQHLELTTNYGAIADCEIVIVCVSTGDEKKLVLGHVQEAVRQCLRVVRRTDNRSTILVYSTLPFGSSAKIREIYREENTQIDEEVSYCYMPLMIAQGSTAIDFVNPPFIAFGAYTGHTAGRMMEFYLDFIRRSALFNGRIPPHFSTTPEIAEMTKLVANAFLSTKISFSNMVARFCEANNLDGREILQIVGSDWRIGTAMLKPGYAFGGACFPRDLDSLIESFEERRVVCPILESTREINKLRTEDPLQSLESNVLGKNVLVLGTAYKPGIRDTRGSPSLRLIEMLRGKGYNVTVYDPNIDSDSDLKAVIAECRPDIVIVTTGEPMFRTLGRTVDGVKLQAILDYAGTVDPDELASGTRLFRAGSGWIR